MGLGARVMVRVMTIRGEGEGVMRGWEGTGRGGMGWNGMERDGMGWDGMGWDGMGWDGMG